MLEKFNKEMSEQIYLMYKSCLSQAVVSGGRRLNTKEAKDVLESAKANGTAHEELYWQALNEINPGFALLLLHEDIQNSPSRLLSYQFVKGFMDHELLPTDLLSDESED